MIEEVGEVLISAEEIERKVRELGRAISKDYQGKELLLVGVLKGAFIFLSDLVRAISIPAQLDFISVSSYGQTTRSSGAVRITKDLDESILGKHVLVVEGIVDTGLTLGYLLRNLEVRQPESLEVCTLLNKRARRIVDVPIAYEGFEIPDRFVVGYGLDYAQYYRNLPAICVLKTHL